MPCLELKVASQPHPVPATRLRALLERPGAAILRRNHLAEATGYDNVHLRTRIRIAAVLAVNLTDPPQDSDSDPLHPHEETQFHDPALDPLGAGFAKGLEIWIADGDRAACTLVDADEVPGALAMFDAYLRLARFQPAFQRLDQRLVGLNYLFREGLSAAVQGKAAETPPEAEIFFDCIAPIPEIDDFRSPRFTVRLPDEGLGYFHDLLRSASAWLEQNSFPNILGAK
ncbi:MAG TPA: hypothetical protein VHX37_00730 [Acidobacteriaceae bacterium]|jgi:hypothetical protein|nr:hypothetical protein [Acidobacteriaceae bacterium]